MLHFCTNLGAWLTLFKIIISLFKILEPTDQENDHIEVHKKYFS